MSNNIAIGYNNQVDTATLTTTSGNWSNESNLKEYRLGKVATVSDWPGGSTLRFALAEPLHIGMVAYISANPAVNDTHRVRLYSDAAFSDLIYDSDELPIYPTGVSPFGAVPWGHPSWWTGVPTATELARYQRNIVHILTDATVARYGDVTVKSALGTTWSLGRLFVGQVLRPEIGVGYGGLQLRPKSRSTRQDARDGTPYFDRLRASFAMPMTFDFLTQHESMHALDAQVISDITGEVIAVLHPDDVAYRNRHTLAGRLRELDAVEFPQYAAYRNAFQLEGPL